MDEASQNSVDSPLSSLTPNELEFVAKFGSPAAFAMTASKGAWKLAKHLDVLNRKLLQVVSGQLDRLIVSMPPRHGKSWLISEFFPAWYLLTNPDKRIILLTYSETKAKSWGRKIRDLIKEFGPLFGVRLDPSNQSNSQFSLEGHPQGGLIARGTRGSVTGEGADILVVDDGHKDAEEAQSEVHRNRVGTCFEATAGTRLQPNGAILLVGTRWNDDDLIGRNLRNDETGDGWVHLNYPALAEEDEYIDGKLFRHEGDALWPEQWSKDKLERKRRTMTPYWWNALYQQRPTRHEMCEWPDTYFAGDDLWFDEWPTNPGVTAMAWDPSKGRDSKKGDYSSLAMVMFGRDTDGQARVFVDADILRVPVEEMTQVIAKRCEQLKPDAVGLEGVLWQELLRAPLQEALWGRGLTNIDVQLLDNTTNKLVRIRRLGPYFPLRLMRFKRNSPGAALLLKQLQAFPMAAHDDGPDALEMAIRVANMLSDGLAAERVSGHFSEDDGTFISY